MFAIPVIATVAWSWLSAGWGGFILPLLAKIPWQVWAAIGVVVAFVYYGHVREKRGYQKCTAEVQRVTDVEDKRRLQAAQDSADEARDAVEKSSKRNDALAEELKNASKELERLKKQKGYKSTVCIPKSVTDKYRTRELRNN